MQLTNVLIMDLPEGGVRTLITPCTLTPVRVPLSFDQRKHAGAGDRPGSWMAVAFELPQSARLQDLPHAWDEVIRRHGTLRTAIVDDEGTLALALTDVGRSAWEDVERPAVESIQRTVQRVFDEACRPLSTPSYHLLVVDPDDVAARPRIVIGADHAHVDAWSLLVLVRDLAEILATSEGGGTPASSRDLTYRDLPAPPFAAHTTELLCRPSTPEHVVERWREILAAEDGIMPTFPLPLGDLSKPREERLAFRDVLDSDGVARLEEWCAGRRVRLICAAISALTSVSLALSGRPLRTVLPVHSRFEPRWADSVGWFITNSVLECADPSPRACADAVTSALALGSHPLEPIMRPYGGMPERPGMFALSWLDYRRLPVDVPPECRPQHVSAVVRTDGVMAWFVVTDTGLRVRVRYPDTPEAEHNVERWLDAVVEHLRELAGGEARV